MIGALLALSFVLPLPPAQAAPTFRWRGVLEGFYGQPWTWQQRRDYLPWMARHRMNLFVLAPKDEPLQRSQWRRPLPPEYLRELGRLIREGRRTGVEIAWTLSPFDAEDSTRDVAAAVAKFRQVLSLGARQLVLAFDDTDPDDDQITFANQVLDALDVDSSDVAMTFVPAFYWGQMSYSDYLQQVGRRLDSRYRVGWTGEQIVSRKISATEARHFEEVVRHRLVLGDNYPVQDRLIDSGRLFLGPLLGRESKLALYNEAAVFNASPQPESSKLGLATAADFAFAPDRYDAWRSWDRAIDELGGSARRALRVLALESSITSLGGPAPGSLEETIARYWAGADGRSLRERLMEAEDVETELHALPNEALRMELEPWARKLAAQSTAAKEALDLLELRKHHGEVSSAAVAHVEELRTRAEENPAIVSDLAIDRFLNRALAILRGKGETPPSLQLIELMENCLRGQEGGCQASLGELGRIAATRRLVEASLPAEQAGLADELAPWIGVLAEAARRREFYVRSPWDSLSVSAVVHWRARWKFIPLLLSKDLMERFLNEEQARWNGSPAADRPMPWAARIYLFFRPDSFPARLDREIDVYRRTRDPKGLRSLFADMKDTMTRLQAVDLAVSEEVYPWLDRVRDYGETGLLALEMDDRRRRGFAAAMTFRDDWARRRGRLRSLNGLELCPQLKLLIDGAARWARIPQNRRPDSLDVIYNPVDAL